MCVRPRGTTMCDQRRGNRHHSAIEDKLNCDRDPIPRESWKRIRFTKWRVNGSSRGNQRIGTVPTETKEGELEEQKVEKRRNVVFFSTGLPEVGQSNPSHCLARQVIVQI